MMTMQNYSRFASVLAKSLAYLFVLCYFSSSQNAVGLAVMAVEDNAGSHDRVRLQYGSDDDARQTIDLFKPASTTDRPASNLIIFIHGGAWVSESTDLYYSMGAYVAQHSATCVALVEYRLTERDATNKVWHPDHLNDVFAALRLLFNEETSTAHHYRTQDVVLVGHSAGAWMALTIALDSHADQARFPALPIRSMPALDDRICSAFKAFVCAEPIVSITDMLHEYPSYDYFIKPAFFSPDAQQDAIDIEALNKVEVGLWPLRASYSGGSYTPTVHVIASRGDTLLSRTYTHKGIDLLRRKGISAITDLDTYTGDHGQLLHDLSFWQYLINIM